jgi:glycosyltransferase involved in cell wall biosynthesis
MALGKPVIATRGGGTDEVVFDNKNGFLVDSGNTEQVRGKIELLIGDRSLINRLGKEGRKMVEERFDLEIMTKKYVEVYKKLVSL